MSASIPFNTGHLYRPKCTIVNPATYGHPAAVPIAAATAGTTYVAADHAHKQNCGFPWWLLILLGALVIAALVWAFFKNKKPETNVAIIKPGTGGAVISNGTARGVVEAPALAGATAAYAATANANNAVHKVTYSQMKELAKRQPVFVMYTMDNCGHCIDAKKQLAETANSTNIRVLDVERKDIPDSQRPRGYPYLFAHKVNADGSENTIPFEGTRSVENFKQFIKEIFGANTVKQ